MNGADLEEIYRHLAAPAAGSLTARTVHSLGRHRIGRQADGAPCLLIEVDGAAPTSPPQKLKHIEYRPRERVRVEDAGHPAREATHAIVACRDADEDLRAYFFRIAWMLIDDLGPTPAPMDVDRAVAAVLELFRNLEQPGSSTVQGAWAELLLIAHAANVATAIAAWHAMPREKFDFVAGAERLEVKSTLDELRVHHVSLEQVRPPTAGPTLLASFLVTRSYKGVTVGELVESIRERIIALGASRELARRVETVVARSLGAGWVESATARFDETGALASLRIYDVASIPSVDPRYPPEVDDVRFTVDLSSVPALGFAEAARRGALFEALLPGGRP